MKKLIFSIAVALLCPIFLLAQQPVLFGLITAYDNSGKILKYDAATNSLATVYNFENDGEHGSAPYGSLVQAANGLFYGMTRDGGANAQGVLFSFDPVSNVYKKIFDFGAANGAKPYGSLIQAADGKLYGMTSEGGSAGKGVIFSFDPASNLITKLFDFDGANGANPLGSLLQASDGNLYGLTKAGGNKNVGVIFSWNPTSGVYSKLHDFFGAPYWDWAADRLDGAEPYGSLIQASDGKLYGMTYTGGANSFGTIFSYDITTTTYTKVFDHSAVFGGGYFIHPHGSFVEGAHGVLYGMNTGQGGSTTAGNIFSANINNGPLAMTNVKAFSEYMQWFANGRSPFGSLMKASNGMLYGTATTVLFSVDPTSNTFTKLQDLSPDSRNNNYGHFTEWKCTPPNVAIADAKVLRMGVEANTVYKGYAPAASITLTAGASGGSGTYLYEWSNGATTSSITVSPNANTVYTVTVKDSRGCAATATKEIKVVDVRCGNRMEKIMVCKSPFSSAANQKTQCINPNVVSAHLTNGAMLGSCGAVEPNGLSVSATPNPSTSYFTLSINSTNDNGKVLLSVSNAMGRVMEIRKVVVGQTLQIGSNWPQGLYYIEVTQGKEKVTLKLLKAR